jgi:hypothetical protein
VGPGRRRGGRARTLFRVPMRLLLAQFVAAPRTGVLGGNVHGTDPHHRANVPLGVPATTGAHRLPLDPCVYLGDVTVTHSGRCEALAHRHLRPRDSRVRQRMARIGETDDGRRTIRATWASSALPYRKYGIKAPARPGLRSALACRQRRGQRNRKWVESLDTLRPNRPVPPGGQARIATGSSRATLVSPTIVLVVARSGCPARWRWGPGS